MPVRRFAAVFASIVAAVACGPRIDEDDFGDLCSEPRLANVTPAPNIDGLELRVGRQAPERIGVLCGKATVKETCLADVASATENVSFGPFLVATSGDEVLVVQGASGSLSAVLGPIENANEARLAANVAKTTNACRVRAAGRDFEVYGKRSGDNCRSEVAFVLKVSADGTVQEIDTETLDEGVESCS